MAVTTSVTQYASYMSGDRQIGGCLNGGEDYRTTNKNTTTYDELYCRGWAGDNVSDACKITSVKLTFSDRRTAANDTWLGTLLECRLRYKMLFALGTVSGNNITKSNCFNTDEATHKLDYGSYASKTVTFDGTSSDLRANKIYVGVGFTCANANGTSLRLWLKDVTFTITRTRACYITFKGDSIAEKTTMYDYGTVPSFGSTPTREGYVFKGWSNGSATYTGTLPTAYEQDVTYIAVWEEIIVPPEIVSVAITYGGAQVSAQNKIPAGEGYLIAVGFGYSNNA